MTDVLRTRLLDNGVRGLRAIGPMVTYSNLYMYNTMHMELVDAPGLSSGSRDLGNLLV